MNEDNQYPNQGGNPNQGQNPGQDGNANQNYGNANQNQFGQNPNQQNVDPTQNQYMNQNSGQSTDQDKYWNPNQNQYQGQNQQFNNQQQYQGQNQFGNQNQYGNQQNQYGNQSSNPKKPKSKKFAVTIISAIFALLLIGGGAFAFFNMQKSTKDQLLIAELNSWKQLKSAFENRYQPEVEWAKKAETTPAEYTYTIGADINGDFYSYEEEMAVEIINNSTLSLDVQLDPNKQLLKADLGADVNGVKIDDISAYVTTKELMFGFPFTDDILQIKDEDFGNFMRTLDPYYEGSESLGLHDWMGKNVFSEENKDYLVKEYLLFFYNSIPDEAFTEASEDINVFGENVKANKISMDLNGEQIRDLLVKVLEKAKNDPKFEDIIVETMENATGTAGTFDDEFDIDINEGLDLAITELKEQDISDGTISYTAWISGDAVVQSKLVIDDELIIEGTRQFTNEKQQWDYTFELEGDKLFFVGDLTYKNGEIEDEVTLLDDYGTGFTYEGSEELKGGDRSFYRTLYFQDDYDEIELFWEGDSSYKGDSMEGEHRFGIESYEFDIAILVDETGSFIKNVDIPTDNLVDLGAMDADEIETYMMEDFLTKAQSWAMELYFELGLY